MLACVCVCVCCEQLLASTRCIEELLLLLTRSQFSGLLLSSAIEQGVNFSRTILGMVNININVILKLLDVCV